jgi:site-specific DNA recombinase
MAYCKKEMFKELLTKQPTYFLYCRKSTDEGDRQVLSLDSQMDEAIKRFGDLKIIKLPPESVSAFEPKKRPIFASMIARIRKGEAQGIIAWHPDRLSRNPIDAAEVVHLLDIGKLKDLKFCSYYFDNSPEGKMMLQITLSQSKYSSDKLSKDVKRGMDRKAESGWRPGRAPLGYLNSKTKLKGEQDIAVDPVRVGLMKQLFDHMLTGNYTAPALLEVANKIGLTMPMTKNRVPRKLHLSELYRILSNPFYYGWYEWPKKSENWLKGKHQPIISEEQFNRIQRILGKPSQPRPHTRSFTFTGLMKCGSCGCAITAEEKVKNQKNGNVHNYVYYRCTKKRDRNCPEKTIELKEFNRQIDALLGKLTISETFKDWSIKYLYFLRKEEAATYKTLLQDKQKQLITITEQLDALLFKYASPENRDGEYINAQEYSRMKSSLLKEKSRIEDELNGQGKEKETWLEMSERTFNFARYASTWFEKGDEDVRRAIFACLGSSLILTNKKIEITLRKPFEMIFTRLPEARIEIQRLEPIEIPMNTTQFFMYNEQLPIWSG